MEGATETSRLDSKEGRHRPEGRAFWVAICGLVGKELADLFAFHVAQFGQGFGLSVVHFGAGR